MLGAGVFLIPGEDNKICRQDTLEATHIDEQELL